MLIVACNNYNLQIKLNKHFSQIILKIANAIKKSLCHRLCGEILTAKYVEIPMFLSDAELDFCSQNWSTKLQRSSITKAKYSWC